MTICVDNTPQFPVPLISHEIGQWAVYPALDEIAKYTGVLQPRNFELVRDDLKSKHMLDQAAAFTRVTGEHSALLYKIGRGCQAMPEYRRNYVPGGTYFFTCTTLRRSPILATELGRRCLREAITAIQTRHPFQIVATVLIPDHWHTIWTLPQGDDRYPLRWSRIKEEFTERWLAAGGSEQLQSAARRTHRLRGVWQKRYWEHTVRDEDDLERCVDYIHWNPRKHRLVRRVRDWPWSSFARYVARGHYDINWGGTDPTPRWDAPEWGE